MNTSDFDRTAENEWLLTPRGRMRVPAVIFADEALMCDMDEKVREQICNVATLPGIVEAAYAMPDAHWGYGFPIGGVAAFDAEAGGVISAGGVGFDISCGVRTLLTGLTRQQLQPLKVRLADRLFQDIPVGVGSKGRLRFSDQRMRDMLRGGARWAVENGWGESADLDRTEERGCMAHAQPRYVSDRALDRQRREMGTLGSGNHYLEVQCVTEIHDPVLAAGFGLEKDTVVVSIHCGSRGLGHQIGTEFLREMVVRAADYGLQLPDRELACAPIESETGRAYLGAMRSAINCAFANRQILTHLARECFAAIAPEAELQVLYDVSHNTCKLETHEVDSKSRQLFVHRKGATRALPPDHPGVVEALRPCGQPVLIGGSMGTASYILAGSPGNQHLSFSSACHGAGRAMSRNAAKKRWQGSELVRELASKGVLIRSPSMRGVAEEAPGAYKRVERVVDAAEHAGLARKVARLEPIVCIKG